METADEEFLSASLNFMDKAHDAKKPFFDGSIRPGCTSSRI